MHKCLSWNKHYWKKLDEKLKKRLKNTFKFFDNVINKFNKIISSVPIEKEVIKIDKDHNEGVIKIKFIDSARFMAVSLRNVVHNLTEEIHKIKCKDCDCPLECESVKGS